MWKLWQKPCFVAAKKFVSSCSLILLAIGSALADIDYQKLDRELQAAKSLPEKQEILRRLDASGAADEELRAEIATLIQAWNGKQSWAPSQVEEMIHIRAKLSSFALSSSKDAEAQVKKIKSNPLYQQADLKKSSNWMSQSLEKFGKLISQAFEALFGNQGPRFDAPAFSPGQGFFESIGGLLKAFVYVVLGGALLLFAYLVVRHVSWKKKLTRVASMMMEDDEPERTRDEWLELAQQLTAEGRYREAVRCLYLAALLRFDEAGVARFIRSQTNWEHLARIETSPTMIEGLDFRRATKEFDRVWYGFRVKGVEDVEWFRTVYSSVSDALGRNTIR